ncbi:MAG: hypothetical protein K0U76_17180 [Actinomycetia bacterium]|nr:hypothetical protein [Actinomycetes bacterium]MCH9703082.1 hypothetical protein [Actinomycetes bacterium]MCH9762382.1 hypothetical protein [Actinomycetes bacterium]
MTDRHEVEWTPPAGLDTGQTRINYHHRPEALLRPTEDQPDNHQPENPNRVRGP